MLLDEPFAGIDPIAVGDIQQLVRHLTQRGIGVLITDHNVRETLGLIDRAYIIACRRSAHRRLALPKSSPIRMCAGFISANNLRFDDSGSARYTYVQHKQEADQNEARQRAPEGLAVTDG
jgi:ABC-type nitrate/sulfonate/bicarbonate transport system ATPase subunit